MAEWEFLLSWYLVFEIIAGATALRGACLIIEERFFHGGAFYTDIRVVGILALCGLLCIYFRWTFWFTSRFERGQTACISNGGFTGKDVARSTIIKIFHGILLEQFLDGILFAALTGLGVLRFTFQLFGVWSLNTSHIYAWWRTM